jgi:hypothetical protein
MKQPVLARNLTRPFLAFTLCAMSARALTIVPTFDVSVTSLSGPVTNAAAVEAAFAAAAQTFENQYTNAITINFNVYWGATGPFSGGISLGESETQFIGFYTYAQLTNALFAARVSNADKSAVAGLPASDPIAANKWFVPRAEAKALGLSGITANAPGNDGSVGFAASQAYAFDPNNRAVAGKFDLIGVMEHEISEALGRTFDLNEGGNGYVPYDLFRFTGPGVRNFGLTDTNAALVYFSVDNGATPLKFYYTNFMMGDIQDWQSSAPHDSFDAFVPAGVQLVFSYADSATLDILGYNSPPVTAPHLAGAHLINGNFQITFTNGSNAFFSVMSATNVALAATNWTLLGAPTQTSPGHYQFTDTSATGKFRFYRVSSP